MNWLQSNRGRIALITCFSTFILGYMNAHVALFDVGAFVSPQTGNLINMAIRLGRGDIGGLIITLLIFGGFFIGCYFSTTIMGTIKDKKKEFFIQWSIFYIPILLNLIFIHVIHIWLLIFSLSFISGAALCFFRKIGDIEINNNIVTGNMRFIGNALFDMTVRKNKAKRVIFWTYGVATFLFFFGALVMTLLYGLGRESTFLVLVLIGAVPYLIGFRLTNDE